jgi:hypothetical protein
VREIAAARVVGQPSPGYQPRTRATTQLKKTKVAASTWQLSAPSGRSLVLISSEPSSQPTAASYKLQPWPFSVVPLL